MKTLKALAALCVLALFSCLPALADGPVEFRFSG